MLSWLSPQWTRAIWQYGNSCTWVHDVWLNICEYVWCIYYIYCIYANVYYIYYIYTGLRTTIPSNHHKAMVLNRSKIKWWAIHMGKFSNSCHSQTIPFHYFKLFLLTTKPPTMTHSAQSIIPLNHHKTIALRHSKMKWQYMP